MVEQSLVLIKPVGVLKGMVEEIKKYYLDAGLRIVQERVIPLQESQVRELYKEHIARPFFEMIVAAMITSPVVALVLEGDDAIKKVRALNGATDPRKADPGTIRHDFRCPEDPFNVVHGSDSSDAAIREIRIVFADAL